MIQAKKPTSIWKKMIERMKRFIRKMMHEEKEPPNMYPFF